MTEQTGQLGHKTILLVAKSANRSEGEGAELSNSESSAPTPPSLKYLGQTSTYRNRVYQPSEAVQLTSYTYNEAMTQQS